ncbi:hypothetical protein QBC46DRAFT_52072 [Diplogelasinospora grovesii]|uniref:Uncharacterized protein n=1 Tax=Diplogelasinospora grovesii TaxID=303347 RepID=A0AAN6MXW0_9PEZI|nr:hypothetical protein QBC46DRAFT_52072 [Diplogelasinospora grovesii]
MSRINSTAPQGANPITRCRVHFLSEQKPINTEPSGHDLGFTGQLGGRVVRRIRRHSLEGYMIRNGILRMTSDTLKVEDLHVRRNLPRQNQLIPWDADWGAILVLRRSTSLGAMRPSQTV